MMTRYVVTALLYASLGLAANAAGLDATTRADIEALRQGDMRKLVLRDDGRDLSDAAFQTVDGATVTLGDSQGKIRVLNFWATWCKPCRAEKPALDALNKARGGADFEVIAVATGRNPVSAIKKFNSEVGIETLTTYLDPKGQLAQRLGVFGLPASIIIDRDGVEIARMIGGANWTSDSAAAIFDRLIAPR